MRHILVTALSYFPYTKLLCLQNTTHEFQIVYKNHPIALSTGGFFLDGRHLFRRCWWRLPLVYILIRQFKSEQFEFGFFLAKVGILSEGLRW